MAQQNYSYAVDGTGKLINVQEATSDGEYFCPYCGQKMFPRMGKVRRWHFSHKANANCSYETYLHKIAKLRIRKAFLASKQFFITYDAVHECISQCPFSYKQRCHEQRSVTHDIRKYYDQCLEEQSYCGYVPDLLLLSSIHPNEPIFIEIYVTHKSTEQKIASGFRIIEIPIKSEDDIEAVTDTCSIKACTDSWIEDGIKFYNFNKKIQIESGEDSISDAKYVFTTTQTGHFKYNEYSCYESPEHDLSKQFDVVVSNYPINFTWAFMELNKRGLNVKKCMLCKFYKQTYLGDAICVLYRKMGKTREIKQLDAESCPNFEQRIRTITDESLESDAPGNFMIDRIQSGFCDGNNSDDVYVKFIVNGKETT